MLMKQIFLFLLIPMLEFAFGRKKDDSGVAPRVKESEDYLKQFPTLKSKLDAALNAALDAQGRAWPDELDPVAYISGALRVMPLLASNLPLMGAEEMRLADLLVSLDQAHVFAGWPALGERDDEKRALFAQLATLEKSYPGGLAAYVTNSRALLADAKEGKNPLEGARAGPLFFY